MQTDHLNAHKIIDLDLDVSLRQAFGASYMRPKDLESRIRAYRAGKLVLPPQPVWQGDPTDWSADPFEDRNWRFQHHTLRWLNPLRWAALEGDEEAGQEWVRVVKSWAETNVPAAKSPSDFAWRDMADGNRSIQLSLGAPLITADNGWFVELLKYHREWLMNPDNIVGKNHGLHQHAGLLVLGAVLRDRTALNTAVDRMRQQFATTFDRQGVNDEGSSVYHQHNMVWWSQAWRRAELEGEPTPEIVATRLEKASEVLAHIALPDGELPQIGDAGRGKVRRDIGAASDFVASSGLTGTPPSDTVSILERGYIASRSGWGEDRPLAEESHALIRYGEDLRAHSHHDRGSLHIYAAGQRWLVDSGFHSYHAAAPVNRYLKSRQAHNLATLEGYHRDDSATVELMSSCVTEDFHDFVLADRGYAPSVLSRRIIYLVEPDCWVVIDSATTDEKVNITQNWIVEPGSKVRIRDNGFRLDGTSTTFGMYWLGRNVKFSLKRAVEGSFDAWVGTKWKYLEPGAKITASSAGSPHLVSLLGANNPETLAVVESRLSSNGNILLHIVRGSRRWRLTVYGGEIAVRSFGL